MSTNQERRDAALVDHLPMILIAAAGLVLLITGSKIVDFDYANYFYTSHRGGVATLDAHKGYLFEGMFGDLIAFGTSRTGLSPKLLIVSWFVIGIMLILFAIYIGVRNHSFDLSAVFIAAMFTRVGDTSLWMGKMDTTLIFGLMLIANDDLRITLLGVAIASFVHPSVSVIAVLGLLAVEFAFVGRTRWIVLVASLTFSAIDLAAYRIFFPDFQGREKYLVEDIVPILVNGIEWGLPSLLVDVVCPALFIVLLVGYPRRTIGRWAPLLLWLLAVGGLTSLMVLDHTRVAGLLTLLPSIVYLKGQIPQQDIVVSVRSLLIVTLICARLAMPHYDEAGPDTFHWPFLRKEGCLVLEEYKTRHGSGHQPAWCPQ